MMMDFSRKIPIGVQSFEVMRNDKFLYVDKTAYLFKMAHSNRVYFLSRPRRFGKSLFLSTLKAYFLGQKELFKGLYLEKAEVERARVQQTDAWVEYPVLYLDFNLSKYETREDVESLLNNHLCRWEELYGSKKSENSLTERFFGVISRAYQKTGKQVVFLADEYDKPLLETMPDNPELNETCRKILKSFYGVIKSSDQYIRFAFLTGVTKFSKVSVFSDLNNLKDISMLNDYAELCGLTQDEIEQTFQPEIQTLAAKSDMSYDRCLAELKKRYDGYTFSAGGKSLYNPFSILNTFDSSEFKNYWFATGTPTFLVNYLKEAHYNVPDLDGKVELTESGLSDYRADARNPLPILFQAGYLTIQEYVQEAGLYRLGFPNDEVRYGFLENLLPAYSSLRSDETGAAVWRFAEDVRSGNVDGFMERMRAIIAGVPYDNLPQDKLKLREQNYQTAVYLIFKLMGQFVQTEVHCATGRIDCVVELKDTVYIFEFKLTSNGSADDALAQIKEKNYTDRYAGSGKKIIAIGASFDKKKRTIKEWKCETIKDESS